MCTHSFNEVQYQIKQIQSDQIIIEKEELLLNLFAKEEALFHACLNLLHRLKEHLENDDMIFGPALLEAYRLESDVALYPRIVFSDSVKDDINTHMKSYAKKEDSPQDYHIYSDSDNLYFINYLYTYFENFQHSQVRAMLLNHKENIIRNLVTYKNNPKVLAKYNWLAMYHNFFCKTYNLDGRFNQDILIFEDKYNPSIRRMSDL